MIVETIGLVELVVVSAVHSQSYHPDVQGYHASLTGVGGLSENKYNASITMFSHLSLVFFLLVQIYTI